MGSDSNWNGSDPDWNRFRPDQIGSDRNGFASDWIGSDLVRIGSGSDWNWIGSGSGLDRIGSTDLDEIHHGINHLSIMQPFLHKLTKC